MLIDQAVLDSALDLSQLELPADPHVIQLQAEDYTDSSGDSTIRVLVTLAEDVDIESVSGRDVGDLKSAIRRSLRAQGVTVFPYFKLVKPSELVDEQIAD